MSIDELSKYNGRNGQPTYLGVMGVVLDVSGSPFYQPDSSYGIFAGTDCSIALATM